MMIAVLIPYRTFLVTLKGELSRRGSMSKSELGNILELGMHNLWTPGKFSLHGRVYRFGQLMFMSINSKY